MWRMPTSTKEKSLFVSSSSLRPLARSDASIECSLGASSTNAPGLAASSASKVPRLKCAMAAHTSA
jgi:hypothetical protein